MHIPVNPLQAPLLAAGLAATVIIFTLMLGFSLRKKTWRKFTIPTAVLALVAATLMLGHGLVERDAWRNETSVTLEKLYGVKLAPKATSDALIRHKTVDAIDKSGKVIRVKLVGDYQHGGKLSSDGQVLPKLK